MALKVGCFKFSTANEPPNQFETAPTLNPTKSPGGDTSEPAIAFDSAMLGLFQPSGAPLRFGSIAHALSASTSAGLKQSG